jgi:hypothetical protein
MQRRALLMLVGWWPWKQLLSFIEFQYVILVSYRYIWSPWSEGAPLPTLSLPGGDSPAVTHVTAESNLEAQLLTTSEDPDMRNVRRLILHAPSRQLYKATDYTSYCVLRNSYPPVRSAAGTCPPMSKSFRSPHLTSQITRTRTRLKILCSETRWSLDTDRSSLKVLSIFVFVAETSGKPG